MSSGRALRSGAPRMLGHHGGRAGRWFHQHVTGLRARFSIADSDALALDAAGVAASFWVVLRQSTERLAQATRARETGRGRRPSASEIRAHEKRMGLAQQSYDAALQRLDQLIARRPAPSPLQALTGQRAMGRMSHKHDSAVHDGENTTNISNLADYDPAKPGIIRPNNANFDER